jgi:hypothetical protein
MPESIETPPDRPPRLADRSRFFNAPTLDRLGLTPKALAGGIDYTYTVLDSLDGTLANNGEPPLSQLLELANLSAVIGNLMRRGIGTASDGRFMANGPHKYPDLLSADSRYEPIEIKMAMETNKPKGHLAKPGPHLTIRYVLGGADGSFTRGRENRGAVAWIWEIRAGILSLEDFSISNTAGDSGKTAVINANGMAALHVVYCDLERCPHTPKGRLLNILSQLE